MGTATEFRPSTETDQQFEHLFARHFQKVRSFFIKRGSSPDRSLELAQETFIGVYKGLEGFRHESKITTWIYRIAHNVWKNELRSRGADKRSGDETSLDELLEVGREVSGDDLGLGSTLDDMLEREDRRLILDAISTLPPKMQRCTYLRVARDMKYQEIADLMGISIQTVKSQLFQARERLRLLLAAHFESRGEDRSQAEDRVLAP